MSLCLGNGSIWANVIVTYDIHNRLWQQVQSCAWKDVKVVELIVVLVLNGI